MPCIRDNSYINHLASSHAEEFPRGGKNGKSQFCNSTSEICMLGHLLWRARTQQTLVEICIGQDWRSQYIRHVIKTYFVVTYRDVLWRGSCHARAKPQTKSPHPADEGDPLEARKNTHFRSISSQIELIFHTSRKVVYPY